MIHLHVHTEKGSILDSILPVKEVVKFAKDNKLPSIAVTDHGNMHSFVDLYKECTKNNVKPIFGCEVYEVDDMYFKNDTKENKQPRYHLILLAKNRNGLNNLFKIVTASFVDGFYGKPRVDLDYIEKNNLGEGIVCLTACMAGRLSRMFEGKLCNYTPKSYIERLNSIFDYVTLEIQSHDSPLQIELNGKIVNFAQGNGYNYVVTTDAHMLTNKQLEAHSIFVQVGSAREVGETYNGCYLQTEKDIHDTLDKYHTKEVVDKAIAETHKINNMIESFNIGIDGINHMPKIECPKEFSNNLEYMRSIMYGNFERKFGHMTQDEQQRRKDRIEMEIPILEKLGYIDYFLMLELLTKHAKSKDIPLGFSRGSGGNCLCLFMLDVTQIDSVRWELDFSRFANLGRKSVADYDMDISQAKRKEMVLVSEELFGKEKVAPICTFGLFSTKVAIKDIGKVLNEKGVYDIPYALRDEVSKLIPTIKTLNDLGEEDEKETLLKDVLLTNERLKEVHDKFPLWFKYVMELEGKPKSLGQHACGCIISDLPIVDYSPMCLNKEEEQMLQLEMHNAMDDLGLCKMDFLGLETLDIIDDCLSMCGLTWNDVDINHLNLNDKNVYDSVYKKGNTVGIFQMESAEAVKLCIEAETDNIEDVIAINAFNRPGTKSGFPTYVKNKKKPSNVELVHEDLRSIFNSTHSVLLYQEQALQIFRLAGFDESEVDNARRAIGKKEKETMMALKGQFEKGLKNRNWSQSQIDEIWALMLKQAEYSFNRGHSVAYGLLSYLTAYLKHYHTLEFMTACLNAKISNPARTGVLLDECNRLGIKVSTPSVNKSSQFYTPNKDKNEILYGLNPIKGVGKTASQFIIANRPYKSLNDFFDKMCIKGSPVNKTAIISLIKSGSLPVRDKNETLIKYAEYKFEYAEFKPVSTLPTKLKLELEWGIDCNKYTTKEERLTIYNEKKKVAYDANLKKRKESHINTFLNEKIGDQSLYEFETLSMFLTDNPFKGLSEDMALFSEVSDLTDCTILCSIVDIKRKKDKRNKAFAYLDLFTNEGIIEGICWNSQYEKYNNFIKKGKHVAMLGKKKEDKFIVSEVKPLDQWKIDRNIK